MPQPNVFISGTICMVTMEWELFVCLLKEAEKGGSNGEKLETEEISGFTERLL